MKLAFWITTNRSLDVHTLDETPLGGCEIEALHLARELHALYATKENQWPVMIFANVEDQGGIYNHGLFFKYDDMPNAFERFGIDVLICVRAHDEILSPRKNKRYFFNGKPKSIVLWSGDSYDQPNNELLHDSFAMNDIDRIVLKGEWQKKKWLDTFPGVDPFKIEIINKGLNIEWLPKEKSDCLAPRFIYASTAYRGLSRFLEIWPLLKQRIPEATLDCYCKTTLYHENNPDEINHKALYDKLSTLPGVTIKEPLSQKEFFKILSNYYAMLYPNHIWEETVCGVALETMACGVPVVATDRAGLTETILAGESILVAESDNYVEDFVDYVHGLWIDKDTREYISHCGFQKIRQRYDIRKKALQWKQFLDGLMNNDPVDSFVIGRTHDMMAV